MQAADKGFTEAFVSTFPAAAVGHDRLRARAESGFTALIERAKDAGALRADFTLDDLVLLLLANGGVVAQTPDTAQAASRRLVALMLHAFRADGAAPLPPAPRLGFQQVLCPPTP